MTEAGYLRLSATAMGAIAAAGMAVGLWSGAEAVLFDGMVNLLEGAITLLMLAVARLVIARPDERFQFGYWHFEPMVLGLRASVMLLIQSYGFLSAIATIVVGGNEPDFVAAAAYCLFALAVGLSAMLVIMRGNRRLGSQLLAVDITGWKLSNGVSLALLIGYTAALLLQGGPRAWVLPWLDPIVLAFVSLAFLPMPWRDARAAFAEIFQIVPEELDEEVRAAMDALVTRHAFAGYNSHVAREGRGRRVEIAILLAPGSPPIPVAKLDAVRREIAAALGGPTPDLWLTVSFTGDPSLL